jgi:hypothetical protein
VLGLAALASALLAAEPPIERWDCVGKLTPPIGYRQETAFVDRAGNPNPLQAAIDKAREKLIAGLCDQDCASLSGLVRSWKTGDGGGQVCAMAVLEERDYAEWSRGRVDLDLTKRLAPVVEELFGDLPKDKAGKPVEVAVVIDKIIDQGVPGGPRATWLRDHMQRALYAAKGIRTIEPPKAWAGDGVPKGAGAVLYANVLARREGQKNLLEIAWKARLPGKASFWEKPASGVLVLEAIAPKNNAPAASAVPTEPTLSIRVEAASGGSLCVGQTTQLWVRSSEERYLQVYNLYGKDKALLLFPNEDHPDGTVRAGETIAIGGPEGFAAVPMEGTEVERFVVLGAPKRELLGPLKDLKGTCRVRAKDLALVGDPKTLSPSVVRAGDGFRIIRGEACKNVTAPSADEQAANEKAVRQLAQCQ